MTRIEYRNRSKRAPGGGFRLIIGEGDSARDIARLKKLKDLCAQLARRGEWDVLQAAKDRRTTLEEIDRLIHEHGWSGYRAQLVLEPEPAAPTVPTLEEHAAGWLRDVEHDATRSIYERDFGRLCDFRVGGRRLGERPWHELYEHEIADAFASLRDSLAWNTRRTVLGGWGSFFTWAIKRERSEARSQGRAPRMTTSPVRRAEIWGKPEITRHRFLSREEFAAIQEVTIAPMRAQYATLVFTGMRIGEFRHLPPEHMRLPTKISVGPWGGWKPKNKRGTRDIPIHQAKLLPLLEEYRDEWAGDHLFFVNPNTGEPWSYTAFADRLQADVEAAGMVYGQRVDGEVQPDGLTPHAFRHTLATWLCQDDVQLTKIAAILGDTVEVVAAHYAHHLPDDLDQAVNQL